MNFLKPRTEPGTLPIPRMNSKPVPLGGASSSPGIATSPPPRRGEGEDPGMGKGAGGKPRPLKRPPPPRPASGVVVPLDPRPRLRLDGRLPRLTGAGESGDLRASPASLLSRGPRQPPRVGRGRRWVGIAGRQSGEVETGSRVPPPLVRLQTLVGRADFR